MMKITALALALCCFVSSCSTVELYSKRRVDDFRDCFAFQVAPGTGDSASLAVGVELPGPIPIGLGYAEGTAYGMVGRRFGASKYRVENASVVSVSVQVALICLLAMSKARAADLDGIDFHFLDKDQTVALERSKPRGRNKGRRFRVGAHAALPSTFVYADIELGEVADLFLGLFFGLDIMKDDVRSLDESAARAESS